MATASTPAANSLCLSAPSALCPSCLCPTCTLCSPTTPGPLSDCSALLPPPIRVGPPISSPRPPTCSRPPASAQLSGSAEQPVRPVARSSPGSSLTPSLSIPCSSLFSPPLPTSRRC